MISVLFVISCKTARTLRLMLFARCWDSEMNGITGILSPRHGLNGWSIGWSWGKYAPFLYILKNNCCPSQPKCSSTSEQEFRTKWGQKRHCSRIQDHHEAENVPAKVRKQVAFGTGTAHVTDAAVCWDELGLGAQQKLSTYTFTMRCFWKSSRGHKDVSDPSKMLCGVYGLCK